ncbi:MAG: hypothetical protein HYW95_02240 [Candidatus Wildermuthbacteria bacterium]|nr:hypothetical protein [Candidatus Wildermuthbacteria bacterium]
MDIIPKKKSLLATIPWIKAMFVLSIIAFVVTLFSYGILKYLGGIRDKESRTLEAEFRQTGSEKELDLEKNMQGYKRKINDYRTVVSGEKNVLPLLAALERNIHKGVVLNSAIIDVEAMEVSISGEATDFLTLQEQVYLLEDRKKNNQLQEVQFSGIGMDKDGKAIFGAILKFPLNFNE